MPVIRDTFVDLRYGYWYSVSMRRHWWTFPLILLIASVLSTGIFAIWLYAPNRPHVLVLSDPWYKQKHLSRLSRFQLQVGFALEGWTLRVETLELPTLSDAGLFKETVAALADTDTRLVVTTAVVTHQITQRGDLGVHLRALSPNPQALFVGIGAGSAGEPYDIILVRDRPDYGWVDAASEAVRITTGNPLPTVILYDEHDVQATADAALFGDHFDAPLLERVPVGSFTDLQIQATMESLASRGAMLIVVPHVKRMDRFSNNSYSGGMRWIVDSLYADLISPEFLEGVVQDDILQSLLPLLGTQPDDAESIPTVRLPLVRTYRANRTGWRNWF